MHDMVVLIEASLISYGIIPLSGLSFLEDKFNTNAPTTNTEPSGTPLSPRQADDDGLEGIESQLHSANDQMDEDDPFAKRR